MPTAVLFVTTPSAASLFHPPNPKCSTVLIKSPPLSIHASSDANAVACRRLHVPPLCATAVAAPGHVGGDLLEISRLGISEQIVSALSRRGITELFPIQRAVLEPALEGRDMIGRAITGSGKTLAFAIPILDKIIQQQGLNRHKQAPSALVLTPTRELARQVQHEFRASAPRLRSTCLYGGIPITNQERILAYGMDIVVGTPGRIIDLVERSSLDLSEVKFVVLDEADQMLAVGFQEDVERILSYLPARKQCMLFSATMPHWIDNISRKFLRDPLLIDLVGDSDQKLADGISLYSVPSSSTHKQSILPTLISMYAQGGKSIIFTKTKRDAEVLSRSMERIIGSKALHGDMQQFQRDKTIGSFREGRFSALVATDVAARGLDIPNVDLVVHFEIPNSPEIFLHRSGRTGRAGNKGTTVLMFTESQRHMVQSIEQDLGCKFEELRGISGQKGNINSNKFYDDSTGEDLWFSDDSDDAQSGNDRRYQRNSYGNFQRNYRSRGNTQYGDTHRLQRSNAYRNHTSQEGPKSYNFPKSYQSRSPYPPSASRRSPSDKRDHWNARKTEGEFEFSEQSDPFDKTMGSRKYHQKRSEGNQDDFGYFSDLF